MLHVTIKNERHYCYVKSLETLYDNILTKIIATITYFLVETIGSFLYLCVNHFEDYGGDPQKRSISNRLFSFGAYFLCWACGFSRVFTMQGLCLDACLSSWEKYMSS